MSARRLLRLWGVASLALALFVVLGGLWVCRAQEPVYDSGTHERLDGVLVGLSDLADPRADVGAVISVTSYLSDTIGALVQVSQDLDASASVMVSTTLAISDTVGVLVQGLVAVVHAVTAAAVAIGLCAIFAGALLIVKVLD